MPLKTVKNREQLGKVTLVEWKDQRENPFGENSLKVNTTGSRSTKQ